MRRYNWGKKEEIVRKVNILSSSTRVIPCHIMAQLRTNKNHTLLKKSYLHKIDAHKHSSQVRSPLYKNNTHTQHTQHKNTVLSPQDLWTDPVALRCWHNGVTAWPQNKPRDYRTTSMHRRWWVYIRTCTNADFRSKVSSKFTLSLLLNREMYVSLWARPISLIYDVQHSKIYHVNCLFNHFLMKHSIFVSDS